MAAQTAFFKLAVCLLFVVVAESFMITKPKAHRIFEEDPMELAATHKSRKVDITNKFLWMQETETIHMDSDDKKTNFDNGDESQANDFDETSGEDYENSESELGQRAGIIKHAKCPVGFIKVSGQCFPAGSLD